jgi:polyisoprenoid-binding protein YceI
MKTLTAPELRDSLSADQPPLLVQVLPEEHFATRRLAGSVNACTYETAFVSKIREMAPALDARVVVYGEGAPSLDSADAAEKLAAAGYSNVADFRGGLREWEAAGFPLGAQLPPPSAPVLDGVFQIDTAGSVIRWTGQNLFSHHEGTVKLAAGSVVLAHGHLERGEFTIDLDSIACTDLADSTMAAMLVSHLRAADFFQVAEYPTASFVVTDATPIDGATEGAPNYLISGRLTLRGVTRELSFPAVIAAADAEHVTAQAHIQLDRTLFGSRYGSGKFFAFLGKHVVNDLIQLHLKIQMMKQA